MGYALCVSNAILVDAWVSTPLNVRVGLRNLGVAPFYYDWTVQLGALDSSNKFVANWLTTWKLSSLLPSVANTVWSCVITNHGLQVGQYKIAMRVLNPWPIGTPLRFANAAQDLDAPAWLTLGLVSILPTPAGPSLRGNLAASGFTIQVSNAAPGVWTVQSSSDCVTWAPSLSTNTTTPDWSFSEAMRPFTRFYRVACSP